MESEGFPVFDLVSILDTNPFEWSTPGINNAPSSATLVGNYVIIAFGIRCYINEIVLYLN